MEQDLHIFRIDNGFKINIYPVIKSSKILWDLELSDNSGQIYLHCIDFESKTAAIKHSVNEVENIIAKLMDLKIKLARV